jgi:hypothetical protein
MKRLFSRVYNSVKFVWQGVSIRNVYSAGCINLKNVVCSVYQCKKFVFKGVLI